MPYKSIATKAKSIKNYQSIDRPYFLDDVSVKFEKIEALRSVQLSVKRGEIVFITGSSGAGKSTLLNVLSGKQNATKGRVVLPQQECFVSQVFQDLRLLESKTCEENLWIAFDKKIYASKNEFYHELVELSRLLSVEDRLSVKIKHANGGLKQKIAIMRALLSRPDILLADEPTCSLDKDNARKVFDILNFYNQKRGMTIIWASHNKELIKQFSGRIVHLDNGKLIYSGHACFI